MLNEVPPVGYPGMRRPGLMARLRAVNLHSRRARVVLTVVLALLVWYALTSVALRDYIREAVLAQEVPDANDRVSICYLEVEGGRDPSDHLLARFRGGLVPVARGSQTPPLEGDEHVVPGLPNSIYYGCILRVDSIGLVLPFLAIVETSDYQAGLSGHGDRHIVLGSGPLWKVASTRTMWVS